MKKQILLRGLKMRCPKCGEGKLLRAYITQKESCSACGEALGHIRADDGPPWLTIILTGHLIVPLVAMMVEYKIFPFWAEMSVGIGSALLCAALILPRAKGLFIAILWMNAQGE